MPSDCHNDDPSGGRRGPGGKYVGVQRGEFSGLTMRQAAILAAHLEGKSNEEIARELDVHPNAVWKVLAMESVCKAKDTLLKEKLGNFDVHRPRAMQHLVGMMDDAKRPDKIRLDAIKAFLDTTKAASGTPVGVVHSAEDFMKETLERIECSLRERDPTEVHIHVPAGSAGTAGSDARLLQPSSVDPVEHFGNKVDEDDDDELLMKHPKWAKSTN